jgi:hypothetical protein
MKFTVPVAFLDGFECSSCESESFYEEWTQASVRCKSCERIVAILRLVRNQDDERIAEINRRLAELHNKGKPT